MNVFLVQPPIGGSKTDLTPPLGLLQLGATLERAGHTVQIVDLNLLSKSGQIDPNKSLRTQFVKTLPKRSSQIDVLGITCWSYNFGVTMEFVDAVRKKHPKVPIVVGGPHLTFVDREALEAFPAIDYALRDEGDLTFPQLVDALGRGADPRDLRTIAGLTWRDGQALVRNPSGAVVEDLDALPFPAYHLIDTQAYLALQDSLIVEAGRGCPFNCNFCSTTHMFQRKYRVKSPARLIDEVAYVIEQTGCNRFEFLHDNLVANRKHVVALCDEIRARNLDVVWSCTSRTDTLTEDVAQAMFLAGCDSIFFGIESLDAQRQAWTGKKLVPEKIEQAIAMTARQHVRPNTGIIVGFPDETPDELNATLRAAVRWTTDPQIQADVSTAALRLYPGADLYALADQLHYDALASADVSALPGLELRPEWRKHPKLFPLDAIHTPSDQTKRTLIRRNVVRTLLKVCPHTFRATDTVLGLTPSTFLERVEQARDFACLEAPRQLEIWNEVLGALWDVVATFENPYVTELFAAEVPFYDQTPVVDALDHLQHVIRPKRFEQQALLRHAWGEGPPPPEVEQETFLLAIRGGTENVVWFTPTPQDVLATFQRHYATDPRGTLEFIRQLRRGLV